MDGMDSLAQLDTIPVFMLGACAPSTIWHPNPIRMRLCLTAHPAFPPQSRMASSDAATVLSVLKTRNTGAIHGR